MRRFAILLLLCTVAVAMVSTASAALVVYEPFAYTNGSSVFGQTNGNGQTYLRAGVANPPNGVVVGGTPSDIFGGGTGLAATINGIGNGSGSALRLGLGGSITSGTVYFSFSLQITALTDSNNTSGGFFIGLNNSTGTQATNPTVVGAKVSGRIDPSDATKYQLGIFNNVTPTGPATTWLSPSLAVGGTHFVVAAYTFNAGTGDDVSSIWLDPGNLGDASAPAPTMTATGGTDMAAVASYLLRQSPAPFLTIDEIRIGTDWTSVTIPEPGAWCCLAVVVGFVFGWQKAAKPLTNWFRSLVG